MHEYRKGWRFGILMGIGMGKIISSVFSNLNLPTSKSELSRTVFKSEIAGELNRLQKDIMRLEAEIAKNFVRINYLEEWRTNVLVQLSMGECADNENCLDPLPFRAYKTLSLKSNKLI